MAAVGAFLHLTQTVGRVRSATTMLTLNKGCIPSSAGEAEAWASPFKRSGTSVDPSYRGRTSVGMLMLGRMRCQRSISRLTTSAWALQLGSTVLTVSLAAKG